MSRIEDALKKAEQLRYSLESIKNNNYSNIPGSASAPESAKALEPSTRDTEDDIFMPHHNDKTESEWITTDSKGTRAFNPSCHNNNE